jgi:HAMP domain-containing protein
LKSSGKLVAQQKALGRLGDTSVSNERNNDRNYTNLNTVGTTELQTIRSIGAEYCFYYIRYKYVLEVLFDKLMSASSQTQVSEQVRQDITSYLELAKTINSKLNDIIQITNFLAKKRASEMQVQNTEINALNNSINATFESLKKHDQMLQKETSLADLRKSMVEYSQEKNLSAQNLLALYGFLNLVAIGLLFYISRS